MAEGLLPSNPGAPQQGFTNITAEQWAVAGSVINAIPVVCAAEPGPVTRPLATPFRLNPDRRALA